MKKNKKFIDPRYFMDEKTELPEEELENLEEWTYGDKEKNVGSASEYGTVGIKHSDIARRRARQQKSASIPMAAGLRYFGPLARFIRGKVLGIDDSMAEVFDAFEDLVSAMASQSKWSGRNLNEKQIATELMAFIDKRFYPDSQAVVGDKTAAVQQGYVDDPDDKRDYETKQADIQHARYTAGATDADQSPEARFKRRLQQRGTK